MLSQICPVLLQGLTLESLDVSKHDKFVLKTRNCVSKTRNLVFKMMNFAAGEPSTVCIDTDEREDLGGSVNG